MDKPVRRVRGNGQPPQDELPVMFWPEADSKYADLEPEEQPRTDSDIGDFLWAFAIILLTTAVMSFAFGRWSV